MQSPSPFDTLAATYDADFSASTIGRMQRNRVWSFLTPLVDKENRSLKILEINCGTGDDAIQLTAMGHTVIGTDASSTMIDKAKEKISGSSAEFITCPFDQLATKFANEQFDLIFSNFGGLNCIDKKAVTQLGRSLSSLLVPGGTLFLVLLSRCCIWEIMHYGIRGKFKTAFRRSKRSVDFTVNDTTMPIHYYSPGGLKKILRPLFKLQDKHPVGLFIPPSYLEKEFAHAPDRLNSLERREKRWGHSFLSAFGDHYCAIFKNEATNT